ncbi:anti-sigma factor domain-containing protein [Aquabacterium sp.]|uniref:anti-sigma factor n=1 Tax=Aquabacterium sp. TaxID=1872578 RepID=UPI00378338B4
MNLLLPERLDALARDYALGTMVGGARRRFDHLLREQLAAQQAVAHWQGRLAHLAAPVPPLAPRAEVWQGLQQRLFHEAPAPAARKPWWQALFGGGQLWAGALAGALLCVLVLRQQPQLGGLETRQEALPASYVGLLLDVGGKPAVLASSRRHGRRLDVKLLQPLVVPAGQVAQLWGLPKDGGAPFPIGVVPAGDKAGITVTLPLRDSAEKLFFNTARLAVSLQPAPALPGEAPAAPFVLSGHCVKLW